MSASDDERGRGRNEHHRSETAPALVEGLAAPDRLGEQQRHGAFQPAPGDEGAAQGRKKKISTDQADRSNERTNGKDGHGDHAPAVAEAPETDERREGGSCSVGNKQRLGNG